MVGWYRYFSCTTLTSNGIFARRPWRPFAKICVLCACSNRLERLCRQALSADEEGWDEEHGAGVVVYSRVPTSSWGCQLDQYLLPVLVVNPELYPA